MKTLSIAFIGILVVILGFGSTTLGRTIMFGGTTSIGGGTARIGSDPIELQFEEPLSAITEGASFVFDITHEIQSEGFLERGDEAKYLFPTGCIRATTVDTAGKEYMFHRRGIALANDSVYLHLSSDDGTLVGPKFVVAKIASCRPFTARNMLWRNYSK